ncbi:DUF4373 domain-containing protein [Lachnospiraceae bacterium EP-SM-12S-S03]|nr:DUF4373 domain-containing protein [Lachnospiraceae bacterium EP-SM-12S-S03]
MGRGAPNKPGLTYFPKMLDFYEDDKIFDLLDEYGPLGVTIYDCILCIVYKNGYYAEIPLDKLSKMIIKMIGNKWVKNQKVVVQVVHFCSDIGLLDDALMTENIITSVGIQRRYYEIAVKRMKRQLYSDKYWLLDKEKKEEPLLNAPIIQDSSEINGINSEEIQITSEKSPIEIKENKSIYIFPNPEVERAFQLYIVCREKNGEHLTEEQITLLRKEVLSISLDESERLASIKKATVSNWKSFYPVSKKKKESPKKKEPTKNKFNNFESRNYDFDSLERQLLDR